MTKWNGWSAARLLFPLVLLAPVTACVSSPPPDQMARTKLQTAPAAAKSAGLTQNKVLPTNSQQLDATTYRVELNATGRRFNCIIDNTGKVASVQPVA